MKDKYKAFLNKVEYMRKLHKDYFRCPSSTQKVSILRECKAVEGQVDTMLVEVRGIMDAEQMKLF